MWRGLRSALLRLLPGPRGVVAGGGAGHGAEDTTEGTTGQNFLRAAKLFTFSVVIAASAILAWGLAAGLLRRFPYTSFLERLLDSMAAFGALLAVAMAALFVGALFGFLFGLPRFEPAIAASNGETPYRPSQSLAEIADWLTKIIVGLGLVNAREIGGAFLDLNRYLLDQGLGAYPLAGVLLPGTMVVGAVAGFMTAWLVMSLLIGRELAMVREDLRMVALRRAKEEAEEAKHEAEAEAARRTAEAAAAEAQATAARAQAAAAEAVPRLRSMEVPVLRAMHTDGRAEAPELFEAAERILARPLEEQRTFDARRAWGKAQILIGGLEDALRALQAAQELDGNRSDIKIEISEVQRALGRMDDAGSTITEAQKLRDAPSTTQRDRLYLDFAPDILRLLYSDPPNPREALGLIDRVLQDQPAAANDANMQVWHACAIGQLLRDPAAALGAQQREDLVNTALDALRRALENGAALSWLQLLMDPDHPSKRGLSGPEREDDLEVFNTIQAFRDLLAPWPNRAA